MASVILVLLLLSSFYLFFFLYFFSFVLPFTPFRGCFVRSFFFPFPFPFSEMISIESFHQSLMFL